MAQAIVTPLHLTANTAGTLVKTGLGQLSVVVINTLGGAGNVLTIYDDVNSATAGNRIAVIDTSVALGSLVYDVVMSRGIFVVLAGGSAADLTIGFS